MARDDLVPLSPAGDRQAFVDLVNRQRPLMVRTARRCLCRHPALKGLYDEEDAVEGALSVLWADVESGNPLGIEEPGDPWRVFTRALVRWIWAASRRESARKRGGSGISPHSDASGLASATPRSLIHAISPDDLDHFESTTPLPELAVIQAEVAERLLGLLDSKQADVVRLRVDGLAIAEIGSFLAFSERTVNRLLEKIRCVWQTSGLLE